MDKTFSIIKPDATRRNITGNINKVIEENGLRIIAQKRIKLTTDQAEKFYSVHSERPFFKDLIEYMTSEPVIVQVLSGENCIEKYRSISFNTIFSFYYLYNNRFWSHIFNQITKERFVFMNRIEIFSLFVR